MFSLVICLSMAFVLGATILLFKADAQHKRECILTGLPQMTQISRLMNQLVGLNPQAVELRASEKLTQIALAAAITSAQAELVAVLELRLSQIRAARVALAAEQNFIKTSIQTLLFTARTVTIVRMGKNFRHSSTPNLKLDTDGNDIAPQHFAAINFSERLKLSVNYQINILGLLKIFGADILKNFLHLNELQLQRHCAITVEERGRAFYSTITLSSKNAQ